MHEEIPFVYAFFRRKGYSKRLSLAMALHCCDPEQKPFPEMQ